MYKYFLLLLSIIVLFSCKNEQKKISFESAAHSAVRDGIDSLNLTLEEFRTTSDSAQLQLVFAKSRKQYKKIEPFVEYYYQGFSRKINGPALPEIKTDDNVVNDATGFQVLEEIIYSDTVDTAELIKQYKILKTDLLFVKQNFNDLPIQAHHLYELLQHQIIRIAALGITGFDSPVAMASIQEAIFSLESIEEYYKMYCKADDRKPDELLLKSISKAVAYLQTNKNFDSFNRLLFIKEYLMPLSVVLEAAFKTVIDETPGFTNNKVFYGQLSDLMKGKKLNPDAFSPFADSKTTVDKIALGKALFNDNNLSRSNTMSCASCHNADKAFTDGKPTSVTTIHSNSIKRNSPTLLYSSFQKAFFYDLRSQDLENQIENVMNNPDEFNLSPADIKTKIGKNDVLAGAFAKAFPDKKEFTPYEIRNAIAAYVRSLMPFQSRIDEYFRGNTSLTESEINGFNLFTGKGKCATCHFIPLYSGTIPPWYNNTESEVIGVPKSIAWKNAVIDSDLGRFYFNQIEELKYAFKTPTVRNIEKTSPYRHNGVYNSLEDVIQFYDLGGGNGIGMQLEHQTLPFDKLSLTEKEKNEIISFLKTLTDVSVN